MNFSAVIAALFIIYVACVVINLVIRVIDNKKNSPKNSIWYTLKGVINWKNISNAMML